MGAAFASLGGLELAILRRRGGLERIDQPARRQGDLGDRALERIRVAGARLAGTADLADVLQRSGMDLVVGRGWFEVEQRTDVATHVGKHSLHSPARERRSASWRSPAVANSWTMPRIVPISLASHSAVSRECSASS